MDLCLPFAPDGSRLSHKAAVVNEYRVVSKSDLGLLDNPGGGLAEQAVDFSVRAMYAASDAALSESPNNRSIGSANWR